MSTNFSLHNGPPLRHWAVSKHLSTRQINDLADPQGGDTSQQPTSIPSPFARMDLVRAAFLNLGQQTDLSGTMNDRRIVSDAFDVGELFFNQEKFKSVLSVTAWSPQTDLTVLLSAPVGSAHRRLGDALQLFLTQDSETYNFGQINRLFVLSMHGRVVGGTSSKTLFFSSGNNLDWLNSKSTQNPGGLETKLGTHKLFDQTNPTPLYTRDIEYQKLWYALQLFMPGFRQRFQEVDEYLTRSKALLQQHQPGLFYEHIQKLNGEALLTPTTLADDFEPLEIGPGNAAEVVGQPLYRKKSDTGRIGTVSDFIIRSGKYRQLNPGALVPMVLQPNFYGGFMYLPQTKWDPTIVVPPLAPEDWRTNQRPLPGQPGNYPWLTVSDFLEPYLIRLPYALNRTRFFDGNAATMATAKGYLLPLTKTFFDFFDVEDVQNGTVQLKMEPLHDGIKVTLRVPVVAPSQPGNQYITLDRIYFATAEVNGVPLATGSMPAPDLASNKGVIVEDSFTVNLYPFVRSGKVAVKPDYRVQLIESGENKRGDYDLNYVRQRDNTAITPTLRRTRTERSQKTDGSSRYDVIREEFDYVQAIIRREGFELRGVMIPKWEVTQNGASSFAFAIDFGTTNTHIEFSIDGQAPQPFEMAGQVATLVSPEQYNQAQFELFLLFDLEFVPLAIGPGRVDSFPTRTAIAESPTLNYNSSMTETLADFNIPFYFDRQPADPNLTTTNLKWLQASDESEKRVRAFLEELLLLIKNVVLQKGGNPDKTRITWFYPASMSPGRVGTLANDWRELFRRVFGEGAALTQLDSVSESVAPYYYFRQFPLLKAAGRPVVNIDIGGGTSDIVIYENDQPTLITSCRFAGDAIYGDAMNPYGNADHNGFIRKYKERIPPLLTDDSLTQLSGMNARKSSALRSEDIIAFWFSMERYVLPSQRDAVSFNRMLSRDDDFKIVFVLFYVALLYHVARLMKARQLPLPGALTFTGMGSKMLNILTPDTTVLQELTVALFEEVYQQPYPANATMTVQAEQRVYPKDVTAKGGLMKTVGDQKIKAGQSAYVYTATSKDEFPVLTYADLQRPEVQASLLTEVETFIEFFFSLNQRFSYSRYLNVSTKGINTARTELSKNLQQYLMGGIQQKGREVATADPNNTGNYLSEPVEETLFFYPLIGAINHLANALV